MFVRINGLFHLLIKGVYWRYITHWSDHLLTSWDIQGSQTSFRVCYVFRGSTPPKTGGLKSSAFEALFWVILILQKKKKLEKQKTTTIWLEFQLSTNLVGGWTNPFEKYESNCKSSPIFRGWKFCKNIWVATNLKQSRNQRPSTMQEVVTLPISKNRRWPRNPQMTSEKLEKGCSPTPSSNGIMG